jgi:flagellar protein FlaG
MSVGTISSGYGVQLNAALTSEKNTPSHTFHIPIQTTEELTQARLRGENVPIGEEQWVKVIEKVNKSLVGTYTSLEFSIHEPTKQIMVKVLNRDTGETIREIPPEKMLDIVAKIWEMAGLLVDERR